ncbi:putative helicase with zinc finger domain [Holothuria leucospilota]|uniref:Helicase with zinc finger domain n=1 Tax=Holothuria leucospilota TaxID=206669 RepID=A0A9Q1C6K8_HOLLE|nr:putative helicase with zinc finger domain [Holothuria leucospilota]
MASGGYHNVTEIDLFEDDEEEEEVNAEEKKEEDAADEWMVVQKKRGKKIRNGMHRQNYNPNLEIIQRTGQESWFSQSNEEPGIHGAVGPAVETVTRPSSQKRGNQVRNGIPTPNVNPHQEIIQRTGQESWFDDSSDENVVDRVTEPATETRAWSNVQTTVQTNALKTSQGEQQNNSQHLTPLQNGLPIHQRIIPPLLNGLPYNVPKEIVKYTSNRESPVLVTLSDWCKNYTFRLACTGCFTQIMGVYGKKGYRLHQKADHMCAKDLLLCLLKNPDSSTPIWGLIRNRTNPSFKGIYRLCNHFEADRPCTTDVQGCHFAHSLEEKAVWEAERAGMLDRRALMDHLSKGPGHDATGSPISSIQTPQPSATSYTGSVTGGATPHPSATSYTNSFIGGATYTGNLTSRATYSTSSSSWSSPPTETNHFLEARSATTGSPGQIQPFHCLLRVVCKPCHDKGENIESREKFNYCSVPNDHRGQAVIYLLKPHQGFWMQVRPRPEQLHPNALPVMCKWAPNCKHEQFSGTACRFPHCQEEIDLWNYQQKYGFRTIEEVVELSRNSRATFVTPRPAPNIAPSPATSPSLTPITAPDEQAWKYREPPFLPSGNYRRCKYDVFDKCRYSMVEDRYNFCRFAHSDEELEEWKVRHSTRFKENNLRRQDFTSATPPFVKPNMEHVTGKSDTIELSPRSELTPSQQKSLTVYLPISSNPHKAFYSYHWNFQVHRSKLDELQKLGLINDNIVRRHFVLKEPQSEADPVFSVVFMSTVPGYFQQKLQYDFANGPSRTLTMTVSIGTAAPLPQVNIQPKESQGAHVFWNATNSYVVPYSIGSDLDPFYEKLQEIYPPSPPGKIVFQEWETLREDNFKEYFHKMIHLEEEACNEKISRFGGHTEISLSKEIMDGVYLNAQEGELFGKLQISGALLDNSDASQIVSRMANFVLLKFKTTAKTVYQAKILVTNDIDLRQDDSVYVNIGKICVMTEGLKAGTKVKVQMQFEVDRTWFCSMHYGVDQVSVPELVFPPHALQKRFPGVRKEECKDMNPKQEDAARYILGALENKPPFQPGPTLIIGPFGTGKTHALAKIVMRLILTSRDSKILIATHTNSAADWYITEYLHDFLAKLNKNKASFLLRVYAAFVNPLRVNQTILDHYTIMTDGQRGFLKPSLTDVANCRVVVTTLATSIHLVNIPELRGHFTHIFIDEAGQALETETMIPLGLAGPRTVVVLAGDHKQMRPKVHSKEGQNRLFYRSMIERLSILNRSRKCGNTCFLTFNYRMRHEILNFISNFYEGTSLVPMGNHERHPDFYPISFGVVEGKDEARGTSYVNGAEAGLVVAQIKLLMGMWPTDLWGEFTGEDIAVLTPYRQQVKHIRALLRREKLGAITVERVENVQGKQFKVVFISPVRTRNTLQASLMPSSRSSNQSELPKEDYYHGFLSDEGELITAFTRSQCLLFVIGDPVALCGVGECQKIWEKYIGECEKNGSLFPEGTTLKDIMMQIQFNSSVGGGGTW